METHWECQTWWQISICFSREKIESFFSWRCQTSCKHEIGRPEFVFKYRINDNDHERSYGNIIDTSDAILDDFVLQKNFKYYNNHEFHKLSKHLGQTNDFSLFHTNICSLIANLENLEALINNFESNFSFIAVSETWTPKGKSEVKPKKLESYQNYHGNRGSSVKRSCDFYVKEGIKFKPRKDFDIAYHDPNNEFQSTWVEILNGSKPNIIIGV